MGYVFSLLHHFRMMGQMRYDHNEIRDTLQEDNGADPRRPVYPVAPIGDHHPENERRQVRNY